MENYLEIFIQTPCDSKIKEEDIEPLFQKIITLADAEGVKLVVHLV